MALLAVPCQSICARGTKPCPTDVYTNVPSYYPKEIKAGKNPSVP